MEVININGKRWNVKCVTGQLTTQRLESITTGPTLVGQAGYLSVLPGSTSYIKFYSVLVSPGEFETFALSNSEKHDLRKTVNGNVLSAISLTYSGKKADEVQSIGIIDHTANKVYHQPFVKSVVKLKAVKYLIIALTFILPFVVVAGFFMDQFLEDENHFQHAHNELGHASNYFQISAVVYLALLIYYFGSKFNNIIKVNSLLKHFQKNIDYKKYALLDYSISRVVPGVQPSLPTQGFITPADPAKPNQRDDGEKLAEKLATLKSIFEKGLIKQDEYDKKRNELISKL